jgi:raffinose/stachyose/melibiose transport system substrate-binding protein
MLSVRTKIIRVASLVVAAVMAIAVSACSSGGGSTTSNDTVTIGVDWFSNYHVYITNLVSAFEKANPQIKVNLDIINATEYGTLERTRLSSGTGPTVFYVEAGSADPFSMGQFEKGGFLANLSDQPWVKNITSINRNQFTEVDGKFYFLPIGYYPAGLVYDTTLMKQLGWQPATTFSELLNQCRQAISAGKQLMTWPLAGGQGNVIVYDMIASLGITPSFIAERTSNKVTYSTSTIFTQAFNEIEQMINAQCFGARGAASSLSYPTAYGMFASGKAIATAANSGGMPAVIQAAPNVSFAMYPFPATNDPSQAKISITPGDGAGLNANATGAQKAAGLKLLDFMASAKGQAIYAEYSSAVPTLPGVSSNSIYQIPNKPALAAIAAGNGVVAFNGYYNGPTVQMTQESGLQGMDSGSETPKQVLAQMDTSNNTAASG